VAVPPDALRGFDQLLDFCRGQEFPAPPLGIPGLAGWFVQTFPKTSVEGLEGNLDNPPLFDRSRTRTFP
jgi:hypothetical protein